MSKHSEKYWQDLVEKYRNGSISKEDRYLLEKQALDDPFLFDALEGYALYDGSNVKNKNETKIFSLSNIAIAASLLLLVALTFVISNNLNNANPDVGLVSEESHDMDDSSEILANNMDDKPSKNNYQKSTSESTAVSTQDINSGTREQNKPLTVKKKEKKESKESIMTSEDAPRIVEQSNPDHITQDPPNSNELIAEEEMIESEVAPMQEKVTNIVEEVENLSRASAMKNENAMISISDSKALEMVPAAQISKDVEEAGIEADMTAQEFEATPVIGKSVFDEYVNEKIAARGLNQEKPAEVIIQFMIDQEGNISDFKQLTNVCNECEAFAIALLQESGVWITVPPGRSGIVSYKFSF